MPEGMNDTHLKASDFISSKILFTNKISPFMQAFRIALIYLGLGLLWIFLSDMLINFIIKDPQAIVLLNITKGCGYVLATSLLLFVLAYSVLKKLRGSEKTILETLNKLGDSNHLLEETNSTLIETNKALYEEIQQRKKTEEALKESEDHFRYALDESPIPIILYANGEVIKVSKAWTEITGYTIEDIPSVEMWIKQAFDPDVYDIIYEKTMNLYSIDSRNCNGEYHIYTKAREVRSWVFYSAFIGYLSDGRKLINECWH